jgi:TRAP transporter TAXI family solute receptor
MTELSKITFSAIFLLFVGVVVAYQFVPPPPPDHFAFATGRPGGAYYKFSEQYQELLAKQRVDLQLISTAGSVESLDKLRRGEVDAALVQGATSIPGDEKQLSSVASVFYEPLWVFFRKELDVNYVFELKHKRLAIGEIGSGTRELARLILAHNNIDASNSQLLEIPVSDAAEQLRAGHIDAAFFVSSPQSDLIHGLLTDPQVELLSFQRHRAYTQLHPYLAHVVLGEGVFSLDANVPAADKHLLAVTATLVVNNRLHSQLVRQLLIQAVKLHGGNSLLASQGEFPNQTYVELPMHEAATQYLKNGPSWLERVFPFWLASFIDRTKVMLFSLLALGLPLLRGAMPIYTWRMRFKIFRWYSALRDLDQKLEELDSLQQIDTELDKLHTLERELAHQISVPLSYMGEFYQLRLHIKLIVDKLEQRRVKFIADHPLLFSPDENT